MGPACRPCSKIVLLFTDCDRQQDKSYLYISARPQSNKSNKIDVHFEGMNVQNLDQKQGLQ